MTLIVNGFDLVPYIFFQGLSWQYSDIDAPNSGRTMDALMHRSRVAGKVRMDITCKPMTVAEARTILAAIDPQQFPVIYDDFKFGRVTKTMYTNNIELQYCIKYANGDEYVTGLAFPLIEI